MEVWRYGGLETWRYGDLEVWRLGGLAYKLINNILTYVSYTKLIFICLHTLFKILYLHDHFTPINHQSPDQKAIDV